jgi:hypothetical protein
MAEKARPMDQERFWEIVEAADWDKLRDVALCKRVIRKRLPTIEDIAAFRARLTEARKYLCWCIEQHEKKQGKLIGLSDDGFSDLTAHIIGAGRGVYEASCDNPALAVQRAKDRDFEESFLYAVPYEEDYDERAKEKLARQREHEFAAKKARAAFSQAIEPCWETLKSEMPSLPNRMIARALEDAAHDVVRDHPDDDHAGGFHLYNKPEQDRVDLMGLDHLIQVWRSKDGEVHIAIQDEEEGSTTHLVLGKDAETQKV